MLARLDEAEVPLRQHDMFLARQRAEDTNAELCDCIGHQRAMAITPHAVEHDARDADVGIVRQESPHHCRRGLRLSLHVEDQHDRQREPRCEVGGGAGAAARPRYAIEQPHDAYDHQQLAIARGFADERVEQRGRHRPRVEVEPLYPGGGGMKRRIDIVGARFRRPYRDASSFERRKDAERYRRLAGAGIGGRDDETARRHRPASLSAMWMASMRRSRTFTMFPMTMIDGVPS